LQLPSAGRTVADHGKSEAAQDEPLIA